MRTKTKTIVRDSSHFQNTPNTRRAYAGVPIKKSKTVVVDTPRKTKTKTVTYSPVNLYGKQTKTKVKTVVRKK